MPKCDLCGAPVRLYPDGDPRYDPPGRYERTQDRVLIGVLKEQLALLREAMEWAIQYHFEWGSMDSGDWQNELERRGLLVEVPATEEIRNEFETDVMLVPAWKVPPAEEGKWPPRQRG